MPKDCPELRQITSAHAQVICLPFGRYYAFSSTQISSYSRPALKPKAELPL